MGLTEEQQNGIVRAVQGSVPFVHEPFARIAEEVGLPRSEVLGLIRQWSEDGKLREISAILEGSALGYESALVAGEVPEERLDEVVEIVNGHPTVTHNYLRDHAYNLWFTIAVPVEMGLDATVEILGRLTGVRLHSLRRTATFKIGVNFDLETLENRTEATPIPTVEPVALTEHAEHLFRALQTPLPIVERPFESIARPFGLDTDEMLEFGRSHLGGAIRRYVGTLRHRALGVRANAMVVWSVEDGKTEEVGGRLLRAPEVSHCYARNPIEGFPYTVYSMLHGPDLDACRRVADRLSEETGVNDYRLLVSLEEYKKTRLRYFLPELDAWWEVHAPSSGRVST
jgi:DNA-binding Lrp family transcriptional regulator